MKINEEELAQPGDIAGRIRELDTRIASLDEHIERNKAELERNNASLTKKIDELSRVTPPKGGRSKG